MLLLPHFSSNKSILYGNFSFNDFSATIFPWKVQIMHWRRMDEWKSYCEEGNHVESDSTICFSDECSASKRLFSVSTLRFDRDNAADQVARGRASWCSVFNTRPCHGIVWLVILTKCPLYWSPPPPAGNRKNFAVVRLRSQGSPAKRGYTESGSEMTLWL